MEKKKSYLFTFLIPLILTSCSPITFDNAPEFKGEATPMQYTAKDVRDWSMHELGACPTIGDVNILVLPIWFKDSDSFIVHKDNVLDDIRKSFFGTNEETGWRSLKTYYEEESLNKLHIDGVVSDWISVDANSEDFHTNGGYTANLVYSATEYFFTQHPEIDRKSYDSDKDGYLDAVCVVYGAPTYFSSRNPSAENMWGYTYWLQTPSLKDVEKPGANQFQWASYDFMYRYGPKAIERAGTKYGTGDNAYCAVDTHTFIHEMGHVFGLEDLYDYSGQYIPSGGISMQDHNVQKHDPYSILALGWGNAYIPTTSCVITLESTAVSNDMIILTNNFNEDNSPFDNYLIIDFFSPENINKFDAEHVGYSNPAGLNTEGVRVWNIDARLAYADSKGAYSYTKLTSNPTGHKYGVTYGFTNSYYGPQTRGGYLSPLGSRYYNYNVVSYIRNDEDEEDKTTSIISSENIFKDGDIFTFEKFSKQFVRTGLMNNKDKFEWSFKVNIVEEDGRNVAKIACIRG